MTILRDRGAGICIIDHEDNILVLKRSAECTFGESWCLPGGRVDDEDYLFNQSMQEALFLAAQRELWEETKIKLSFFENKSFGHIDTYRNKFLFRTFIFKIGKKEKSLINSEIKLNFEHTEWKWQSIFNLEELKMHPSLVITITEIKNGDIL